jgi:carboxymethylenebutenolidase
MALRKRDDFSLDKLTQMQRYLAEEMVDDYRAGELSRRRMLRRVLLICGSSTAAAALLAACGDPTATIAPTTTAAPATTPATTTTAATTTATATTTVAATTAPATTTAAPTTTSAATTAAAQDKPLVVAANDPAVDANDVSYQSDTSITAYLARPKAAGSYPGIIVIHENKGLTDHIKDVARRVAKAGYIALAPDLGSRGGGTDKLGSDAITAFLGQAKPEDLVKDLNEGLNYLEKQTGIKAGKLGVVGFCFGGGLTLRFAAANPKILAAVPYYGPVPTPVSMFATTNAAILGQYGATDSRVNSGIPDLEKAMKDNNKVYEKRLYDGAGHAFNNDTGGSYNKDAAVKAWAETLSWFGKYLV